MKMESVAISWLVTSASSPLVAVLALWTIYVFHTYRRRWRTVDLFLLAITSQELVSSIFIFCFAITSLISAPFRAPCTFTQWGLTSSRTFQVATLASLVVDRALTVRWPYRYRFSVRRNQIRYHVAVLALVSVLVGVAAVFARTSTSPGDVQCRLHPSQWDVRYVVFLLSLHGGLVLVSLVCMVQVEVHRCRHGTKASGSFQLPECASPDLPTGMSSPLDTQSSTGSTRALHRPSRQASRRPYGKNNKGTSDLRWPSVALTSLLCFFLNHIPYLVLMSLATWHPHLWTRWHEAILAWLGLLEGLLVPLLLFCRDPALRTALRRAFQRRSGALSPLVGDDGPFQMYFDKDHFRKRGTFGSVTPIGIITNYRRTPGKKQRTRKGSGKYTLPGLHGGDSVLAKSCFLGSTAEPLSKLSCADLTSLEMWREEDEENFYATLSDDFSTFSCKSADDSALSEDMRISEELYGGSFTTVANDDFEFHDTRPCGGEVRMKPCLTSPATPPGSRSTSFRGNIRLKVDLPMIPRDRDVSGTKEDDEYKNPDLFIMPPAEWKNDEDSSTPPSSEHPTPPGRSSSKFGTMSKKATSYSMNDLDLIHKQGGLCGGELEATFILPVKSESTMSLYRLNVDQDIDQMAMTPSRSENNVNGDSGFGSGAQSTNPVWSGFLCRKPSDPFWNMRKPTAHAPAASTPTRNYPGILHPRMRKIPWISAWKKLDENSVHNERNQLEHAPQVENTGWKENLVYEVASGSETRVGTIDEELSDVGTPVYNNGDYNLNIFAKESGVLIENAYGKLVRDDCGVQVNFYGKNVQYDEKEDNRDMSNLFERSVEPSRPVCLPIREQIHFKPEDKIENHLPFQMHHGLSTELDYKPMDAYCEVVDPYKCEPRLNGGHYENLFGTKENIFAQCDPYAEKRQVENTRFERKTSNGGSFRNNNEDTIYGQLNKVERFSKAVGKSPAKSKITRRESDNRGNRCGIKRRENRPRSDTRAMFPRDTSIPHTTFAELSGKMDEPVRANPVEIEMKNVSENRFQKPDSDRNLNRSGSQRLKFENRKQPVDRKDSSRERKYGGLERRQSGRIPVAAQNKDIPKPTEVAYRSKEGPPPEKRVGERKEIPRLVERKNSDKNPVPKSGISRLDSHNKKLRSTSHSEGLWANAIPFDKDEENGNSPRKGARKDPPLKRSPRKSNLPRRESSNKNDKPNIKRKTSRDRADWTREDISSRVSNFEDFLKYRDKCEDNFSHIQNLNRETSAEREVCRVGKLNGNIPQEYPENGRMGYLHNSGPNCDENDNRKLTIADFL